jgi:hypothetical protein
LAGALRRDSRPGESGVAMNWKACLSGAALVALTIPLFGCNPYPLPGRLVYGKCGQDAHTESYPLAEREKHAYGCKQDQDGFLETGAQADPRRN